MENFKNVQLHIKLCQLKVHEYRAIYTPEDQDTTFCILKPNMD